MTNELRAMKEIHDIRLKIHEETKDMSPEERAALASKEAQEMIDKYGLKLRRPEPAMGRKII